MEENFLEAGVAFIPTANGNGLKSFSPLFLQLILEFDPCAKG